jgi:hypothetical protein
MTCPDRLGEWLVEALEPDEQAAVGLHVRDCAACTAEVNELRGLEGRLRTLARPRPRRRWLLATGPAIAAGVLFVIVGLILGMPGQPAQDLKPDAREMVAQYERLGEHLRTATRSPMPEAKPILDCVAAIRAIADRLEGRAPAEDLRTIRRSCLVIEMLSWEFPGARLRIEATRKEFSEAEWKQVFKAYLSDSVSVEDLEFLTTTFFRRGRDAAADLADDPSPGIEVLLSVSNNVGKWETAEYRIAWPKGAATGEVSSEVDRKQRKTAVLDAGVLRSGIAELRDRGLLTLRDATKCKCDAPQYRLTATVGDRKNSLHFGHAHAEIDHPQWELVEAVIRFVEKRAK